MTDPTARQRYRQIAERIVDTATLLIACAVIVLALGYCRLGMTYGMALTL